MVRVKHRYFLIHILYPDPDSDTADSKAPPSPPDLIHFHRPSPDTLTPQLLARTIRDQVYSLYGDYGLGLVAGGLNVKYLSPATSTAIIRCPRAHHRLVWAALSFTTELPRTKAPCAIRVVRVSGTIKKVEEEAIRRARGAILRARREGGVLGILREGMGVGKDGDDEEEEGEDEGMGVESEEEG